MSQRLNRINDQITAVAAQIIRGEMADPRIGTVVSVTKADTTRDLKFCKIFISVLGDEAQTEETMTALTKASGFVRKRIAEIINLRVTPEITFVLDDSIAHGVRMRKLIDDLVQNDAAVSGNSDNSNEEA